MDYEINRLSAGLLQLSDNTHLIVDETRLEAGKLDVAGALKQPFCFVLIFFFQYFN